MTAPINQSSSSGETGNTPGTVLPSVQGPPPESGPVPNTIYSWQETTFEPNVSTTPSSGSQNSHSSSSSGESGNSCSLL